MAKNDKKVGGTDEEMIKAFEALLGEGFAELRLERTVWKAEAGFPIVGFVVDSMLIELEDRVWPVYLFETTKPTKAADRNGDIIDVAAGDMVLVTASAQIAPVLNRYCADPEVMYEIGLLPKSKEDIGGGKSLWTFRAAISQKPPTKRGPAHQLRAAATATKALPNGEVFDPKTGEVTPVAKSAS